MAPPIPPGSREGTSPLPQILEAFDTRLRNLEQNREQNQGSSGSLSPDKSSQISPRQKPKHARVYFKGKEYIINVTLYGNSDNNPSPGLSQKFATLYGMTLQYGLAALMHQHNLKEEDINLKYVKIKKKTNNEIYLIYANPKKKQKYKVKIDNHLDITKTEDKEKIINDSPDLKGLDTAYKTHEAAISCLEETGDLGDEKNNPIGKHNLDIPSNEFFSPNAKAYYDPNNKETKFETKPLKSRTSKKPTTTSPSPSKKSKTAEDTSESVDAVGDDQIVPRGPASGDFKENEATEGSVDPKEAAAKAKKPRSNKTSTTKELKALVKEGALDETEELSKEESIIKNIPAYTRDDDAHGNRHSWIEYLLKGILTYPASGNNYDLRNNDLVEREINPLIFNKEEVKEILFKIFHQKASERDKLKETEKIFLKRFVLVIIAGAEDLRRNPKSEHFQLKKELENIFEKFMKISLVNESEKGQLEEQSKVDQTFAWFFTKYISTREFLKLPCED